MIYNEYTVDGVLYHSAKGDEWKSHKYVDKVKTKNGKYRYVYSDPSKKTVAKNVADKEYVEHPYADEEYLDSYKYYKTTDENGDIVWKSTGEKNRKSVNLLDYIIDNILAERDEFKKQVKLKKKDGKTLAKK